MVRKSSRRQWLRSNSSNFSNNSRVILYLSKMQVDKLVLSHSGTSFRTIKAIRNHRRKQNKLYHSQHSISFKKEQERLRIMANLESSKWSILAMLLIGKTWLEYAVAVLDYVLAKIKKTLATDSHSKEKWSNTVWHQTFKRYSASISSSCLEVPSMHQM